MIRSIQIALESYLAPFASARAVRIALLVSVLFVLVVTAGTLLDRIPRSVLSDLRRSVIVPGIAAAAALLSEVCLRDGITHRTLLYPLLGPVSRKTLATVRVAVTGLLLAVGVSLIVLILGFLTNIEAKLQPREIAAIFLGSMAYTALFNVVHLLTRRGLIVSLALYAIFDSVIGRLPFSIRNIAPSQHVRVLADLEDVIRLPITIGGTETSVFASTIFLVLLTAAALTAGAWIFSRKNLGDLC